MSSERRLPDTVFPAQARAAMQDQESWEPARRIGVEVDRVTVDLHGEPGYVSFETAMAGSVREHHAHQLAVSERYGLMAFGTLLSRYAGRGEDDPGPGRLLGSPADVQLIPIRRVKPRWVYAEAFALDGFTWFFIVPAWEARYTAEVMRALTGATTWGEFRAQAAPDLYEEVLTLDGRFSGDAAAFERLRRTPGVDAATLEAVDFDAPGLRLPDDDEPFDPWDFNDFANRDWPLAPALLQTGWVPDDAIDRWGKVLVDALGDEYTTFPPEHGAAVLSHMRSLGYECVEDAELIDYIATCWEDIPLSLPIDRRRGRS